MGEAANSPPTTVIAIKLSGRRPLRGDRRPPRASRATPSGGSQSTTPAATTPPPAYLALSDVADRVAKDPRSQLPQARERSAHRAPAKVPPESFGSAAPAVDEYITPRAATPPPRALRRNRDRQGPGSDARQAALGPPQVRPAPDARRGRIRAPLRVRPRRVPQPCGGRRPGAARERGAGRHAARPPATGTRPATGWSSRACPRTTPPSSCGCTFRRTWSHRQRSIWRRSEDCSPGRSPTTPTTPRTSTC